MRLTEEQVQGIQMAVLVCEDIEKNSMNNIASFQASLDNREAQTSYGIGIGARKVIQILLGIINGTDELPRVRRAHGN